ncbi:MAG: MarR family transcriptional regulator [Intrasporangiaceae bacterium]|nr:MarR family transcriptional regulator [Intrasporangiaceae bacterium]
MADPQAVEDFIAIARQMMDRYAQLATGLGVTGPQMEVLDVLADGPITSGGLADSMHCDPSNVTRLLDRLDVTNGGDLVQRRRSDADRRVVEVSLTDRGRRAVAEHRRLRARDIPLFTGLSPVDRERLEVLLHEIASNLETRRTDVDRD